MARVIVVPEPGEERIQKRQDEPSGNVSRVYEPENISASDESLHKQVSSKLQELNQLLHSRGEGLGPVMQRRLKAYNAAAMALIHALEGTKNPNTEPPRAIA